MVSIKKINNIFVRVDAEESTIKEIANKFSYRLNHYVPKKYFNFYSKKGMKKSLFNKMFNTFYIGLLPDLVAWLKEKEYEFRIEGDFNNASAFSEHEALEFIKTIPFPWPIRDYQLKYFIKAVRNQRLICLSPTSSGKSAIIYLITKYFSKKTLIIVPTVNLVLQLKRDFIEFGCSEEDIHTIYTGHDKKSDAQFVISTWQSVQRERREFFEEYEAIIGDEVHEFGAESLLKIMTKTDAEIRVGLTGSMPENELDYQQIAGLFGPVTKYISTKELMDRGEVSNLLIKAIVLNHISETTWESGWEPDYEIERANILASPKRNEFIANMAVSLKGNTFLMFEFIEHGKELFRLIKEKTNIPVYFVAGEVPVDKREEIIEKFKKSEESITVCSRVFVRGISINSVNNIIFSHPSKSLTKILQSIGRALRLHKGKDQALLIDIADNLIKDDRIKNTTYKHFLKRMKIYANEKFTVKKYSVNLD